MRSVLLLLLLVPLSGCLLDEASEPVLTPEGCDALRDRERTHAPVLEALADEPERLAHRLAQAVGDPVVGARREATPDVHEWPTGNGSIGQTFTGRDRHLTYLRYSTETEWTPWDGGRMEEDLRRVLVGMGLDPDGYQFGDPEEGDYTGSVAVYARQEGVHNAWWRVQLVPQEPGPSQSVLMSTAFDVAALPEMLPDEDLRDTAVRHARCDLREQGASAQVRVERVDETAFWLGDSPGKYVMLKVGDCGGYYILDAVTGARLEGGVRATCPHYDT